MAEVIWFKAAESPQGCAVGLLIEVGDDPIYRLRAYRRGGAVFVSHDLDEVRTLADKLTRGEPVLRSKEGQAG